MRSGAPSSPAARRRRRRLAASADRYRLYQRAVQCPEAEIRFFERLFAEHRHRRPQSLREDFCGTGYLAVEWVKSGPRRMAIGIDIDPVPLAWGDANLLARERAGVRARVRLLRGDVRRVVDRRVDVCCALNFSQCVFKTRAELGDYFRAAHHGLARDGLFVCELFGGTDAVIAMRERRPCRGFTYIWQQERFDPIHHDILCHIHFRFADGSSLRRAFTYDWRLWSIPETRECLEAAGFRRTVVYWGQLDARGVDTGEYAQSESEENMASWLAYVVGVK
jgi:SAM-dependent methyltransferase